MYTKKTTNFLIKSCRWNWEESRVCPSPVFVQVSSEEAEMWSKLHEAKYFETSAKEATNVQEVFEWAIRAVLKNVRNLIFSPALIRPRTDHIPLRWLLSLKTETPLPAFNFLIRQSPSQQPASHALCPSASTTCPLTTFLFVSPQRRVPEEPQPDSVHLETRPPEGAAREKCSC